MPALDRCEDLRLEAVERDWCDDELWAPDLGESEAPEE